MNQERMTQSHLCYHYTTSLSLERLSFSEKEGKVLYRYGKDTEEVERVDYL